MPLLFRARREDSHHLSLRCAEAHHSVGKRHYITMGGKNRIGFLVGVTAALTTLRRMKTDDPVWLDQWPLKQKKLSACNKLVEKQLQKGHIKPTNVPGTLQCSWSTKNPPTHGECSMTSEKLMRSLKKWDHFNLDFHLSPWFREIGHFYHWTQGFFLQHSTSSERCSLICIFCPNSINRQELLQRYHWVVLPQASKICQQFANGLWHKPCLQCGKNIHRQWSFII